MRRAIDQDRSNGQIERVLIPESGAGLVCAGILGVVRDAARAIGQLARRLANSSAGLPVRVVSTVAEQALFSGTNFIVTALMVRWMPLEDFGAYSFAFSIYLLACAVIEAFLAEPITIVGSAKYAANTDGYTGVTLQLFCIMAGSISFMLLMSCLAVDRPVMAKAMLGLALGAPFMLLRSVTQQLCYARGINGLFALAGAGYAVLAPLTIAALHFTDNLNSQSCFLALGVATAGPCLAVILWRLYPPRARVNGWPIFWSVVRDHLNYGRWASLSQFIHWLGGNFFVTMGPILIGLDATAGVRAMSNLCMPVFMAQGAVLWSFAPGLSRHFHAGDSHSYWRLFHLLCLCLVSLIFVYLSLVLPFGAETIHVVYHGAFDDVATFPIVALVAVGPPLSAVNGLIELHLRLTGRIRFILVSKVFWLAATICAGTLSCYAFGFLGAFIGSAFSIATLLVCNVWFAFYSRADIGGGNNE
jgi:O-antigen/teichoic acid export membrane protein